MADTVLETTRNGRKFRMGLYCLLFLSLGLLAAASAPTLGALYGTFVGGVSAIFAIYCGGNIGNKYVLTRPDVKVMTDRRKTPRTSEKPKEEKDSENKQHGGPGPAGRNDIMGVF